NLQPAHIRFNDKGLIKLDGFTPSAEDSMADITRLGQILQDMSDHPELVRIAWKAKKQQLPDLRTLKNELNAVGKKRVLKKALLSGTVLLGAVLLGGYLMAQHRADEPAPPAEVEEPVTAPPAPRTFLSLPRPGRPDLSRLPRGSVHFWSKSPNVNTNNLKSLTAGIDDFVEVQLYANLGWIGLRANGEVLRWYDGSSRLETSSHSNIVSLNRQEGQWRIWLNQAGSPILGFKNSEPTFDLFRDAPLIDLAETYPELHFTWLTEDGQPQADETHPWPPPPHATNLVRIGGLNSQLIAIRSDGEVVSWGKYEVAFSGIEGLPFALLRACPFQAMGLTVDGKAYQFRRNAGQVHAIPFYPEHRFV
ncbi:MAG: hypothetical protein AAF492_31090, partial [Verrucomicrobiota bacterium]